MIDMNTLTDITAPWLEANGDLDMLLGLGDVYEDPGVVAMDAWDGDISSLIEIEGHVDTSKLGEYEVRYNVRDAAGYQARELVRRVVVSPFGEPKVYEEYATILAHVMIDGIPADSGDLVGAISWRPDDCALAAVNAKGLVNVWNFKVSTNLFSKGFK